MNLILPESFQSICNAKKPTFKKGGVRLFVVDRKTKDTGFLKVHVPYLGDTFLK